MQKALTVQQAAEALQASDTQIRRMIHEGIITATRLDPGDSQSPFRIPRPALDPWLGPEPVYADPQPAPAPRPEGGLSRDELRRRAGLPADDAPSGTQGHSLGVPTPGPSGTVAAEHPAPIRGRATNFSQTQPIPTIAEVVALRRAGTKGRVTGGVQDLPGREPDDDLAA